MQEKVKAIIIDDEERARRVLFNALEEYCPEIEVLAQCSDVPQGVLEINRKKPDVVFLDIEMPNYSGFELLEFFQTIDFEIIFVTAYNEYAIKAFEVAAIDYILKPIRIDHLERAVDKLKSKLESNSIQDRLEVLKSNLRNSETEKITVPVSNGLVFVKVAEISHINAEGAYATLCLTDSTQMLVSKKLKYFESLLAKKDNFYRVHRSHLINLHFVKKYNRHESSILLENNDLIKVARDNKVDFEKRLKALNVV